MDRSLELICREREDGNCFLYCRTLLDVQQTLTQELLEVASVEGAVGRRSIPHLSAAQVQFVGDHFVLT